MVKMVVENEYNGPNNDEVNYKTEYRKLKRKLKMLIYVSTLIEFHIVISSVNLEPCPADTRTSVSLEVSHYNFSLCHFQENECFQESLRNTEKKYLTATRDRNYLLERLSAYEPLDTSTSDTEETAESSDDEHLRTSAKR